MRARCVVVGLGDARVLVHALTRIEIRDDTSQSSTPPVIGAAEDGSARRPADVPLAASMPEVVSRPIQPAPGR